MSTKQKTITRPVITYGLAAGSIIVGAMFAGGYFMGGEQGKMDNGQVFGYISMLLGLSTIFLAINSSRKASLGRKFTFWEGFRVGLLITLIATVIYVIGWMIYSAQFAPDFMEQYMQNEIQAMETAGATAEEITKYKEDMAVWLERYENPIFKVLITASEILPVGLLVSLIGAFAFIRKSQE